jgi:hypothetical protein
MSAPSATRDVSGASVSAFPATSARDVVLDWLAHHRSERVTSYDHDTHRRDALLSDLFHTPEWPSNRTIHEGHVAVRPDSTLPPDSSKYKKLMHAFRHAG